MVQKSFNPASTFTELRTSLQNYEKCRAQTKPEVESSLAMLTGNKSDGNKKTPPHLQVCYVCGNPRHFAKQCYKRSTATISKCNKRSYLAKACRNSEKVDKFKRKDENATASYFECFVRPLQEQENTENARHLIVGTGCSDHVVNKK